MIKKKKKLNFRGVSAFHWTCFCSLFCLFGKTIFSLGERITDQWELAGLAREWMIRVYALTLDSVERKRIAASSTKANWSRLEERSFAFPDAIWMRTCNSIGNFHFTYCDRFLLRVDDDFLFPQITWLISREPPVKKKLRRPGNWVFFFFYWFFLFMVVFSADFFNSGEPMCAWFMA